MAAGRAAKVAEVAGTAEVGLMEERAKVAAAAAAWGGSAVPAKTVASGADAAARAGRRCRCTCKSTSTTPSYWCAC